MRSSLTIISVLLLLLLGSSSSSLLDATLNDAKLLHDSSPENTFHRNGGTGGSLRAHNTASEAVATAGAAITNKEGYSSSSSSSSSFTSPVSSCCNQVMNRDSCLQTVDDTTGEFCSWCVAGAVPSECVSQEQAAMLPSAVFECSTPSIVEQENNKALRQDDGNESQEGEDEGEEEEQDNDKTIDPPEWTRFFQFQPHQLHALNIKREYPATTSSGAVRGGAHPTKEEEDEEVGEDEDEDEAFCDGSSKMISGYMDISGSQYDQQGEDKHLFFWMFEKRNQDHSPSQKIFTNKEGDNEKEQEVEEEQETIPFIMWLTGGPGCSSTLALLTENGPCSVNANGDGTVVNPYSWTETAHVLWLDQPAGVGFSYGAETDANEQMVAEDVYYFLQAFFQTYPEYQSSPFYVVGESYAGHYVPAIAHRIYEGNQQANNAVPKTEMDSHNDMESSSSSSSSSPIIHLNLAGLSIGNGLTNPEAQYPWYPEMGVNNSHQIQIFDDTTYQTMKAVVPVCTTMIHQCNQGDSIIDQFACQSAFLTCNAGLTSPYQATGLNPYDIRIKCAKPPLCYDFSRIERWLNNPSTKKALGVDLKHSHSWESCNFMINMKFHSDWMHDFSPYVAELLNAGFRVLIYAGDVDFICNYMGNQAWTYALEWSGTQEFQAATAHDWNGGQGLARSYGGFTFLQVYDAGHMVPTDQPKVSLDMIANFVHGGDF